MANVIKSVSKARPCPICGKPDWCGLLPGTEGGYLIICQRTLDKENTIGLDGEYYVYVSTSGTGASIYEEAHQRLEKERIWKERNGIEGNSKDNNFSFKQASVMQYTVVNEVKVRTNKELDKIYRKLLDCLVLDDVHKEYLLNEGWTEEMLECYNIKSFPEKDSLRFTLKNNFSRNIYRKTLAKHIIDEFGEDALLGVPGAYKDKKGNWTFAGAKGILFPQYDANHNLYRLRIRMDYLDVKEQLFKEATNKDRFYEKDGRKYYVAPHKGIYTFQNGEKVFEKMEGKYRNFSSFHPDSESYQKGFIVNSYDCGCESGNQLGIYYNQSRDNMFICFVTEGEKKGCYANFNMRAPVINVPGVGSWWKLTEGKKGERAIDILKQRGVGMFVIAYDADKSANKRVLDSEMRTIQSLKDEGFSIGIANWSEYYGKGLDDLLFNGHQPSYELA